MVDGPHTLCQSDSNYPIQKFVYLVRKPDQRLICLK